MNTFRFFKYQGTGNDFILFDGVNDEAPKLSTQKVANLCDRRFGIGGDGLMLILPSEAADFKMQYFNSDGGESTMCGNGGRCIVHLAHKLGICSNDATFEAVDGIHHAQVDGELVKLGMSDVAEIKTNELHDYILDTGSPHYIHFCEKDELKDIVSFGKEVRYNDLYKEKGINVNLVHVVNQECIEVATYERGVEDETYSCGTGVTAAAIAFSKAKKLNSPITIKTKGGNLVVHFHIEDGIYKNVILEGPATFIFEGQINL